MHEILQGQDSTLRRGQPTSAGTPPDEALRVTCSVCHVLHAPWNGLAFDSVCPSCQGASRSAGVSAIGFHALDEGVIADVVAPATPGSYALGYVDDGVLVVFYVGRADDDLAACLTAWVGTPSRPRCHRPSPHAPWGTRSHPLPMLATRAMVRVGVGLDTAYTHFAFRHAGSDRGAFEQECRDYHALGGSEGLDNDCHPLAPVGSAWACPVHA